jgi:NAD(P)-dependent dehydrogenase (short-subunit alcohol dehydrogenase family)
MPAVLITGTSTGIGAACVARLAAARWTVYATVRRSDDADRLKATHSGDVRPVLLDVNDRAQMRAVIESLASERADHGLDGLVNNAGVGRGGPTEYLDEEVWRSVFEVNMLGPVELTRLAMPLLRAARGRVVHVGSMAGRLSAPGLAPYAASKHALEALAESQRHELARARAGVRVALIEPGEVKSAIWDKADREVDEMEQSLPAEGRSRYGWLVDQTRGFVAEARRRGVDADKVAQAVEHALTAKRPKARYLVGPDAKLAGHLFTKLPDRVRDRIFDANGRLWERRGRTLRR